MICCIGEPNFGYSQFKEISVSKINKLQVMELRCLDSNGVINNLCPLDLDGIRVEYYKAFLNQKEREIRLIGRCGAFGGIDIFEAIKIENKLIEKKLISETSYDKGYINNDGFFDVTMKVDKNKSLFFHETCYFLREFSVYKLLQN
jgi:hypothetical protein